MHIVRPIGSLLPNKELPNGSSVNAKIVKGDDSHPEIRLISTDGRPFIEIAINDLDAIKQWAMGETI